MTRPRIILNLLLLALTIAVGAGLLARHAKGLADGTPEGWEERNR